MESTDYSKGSPQPNLPPGFRFHPTDEELVVHYLKKKATSAPLPVAIIAEINLYKFDPWELPAKAKFGEQEWYFFSPRDRKYPNGARPNRAATSGYWKATGTDKPVLTSSGTQKVGVKKALVFYGGKPPKGIKTNWIMHEYRLPDNNPNNKPPIFIDLANKKNPLRLDDWVLCRIYKKRNPSRSPFDHECIDDMIGGVPPSIHVGQLNARLHLPKMIMSYSGTLPDRNDQNLLKGSNNNTSQLAGASSSKRFIYWNIEDNNTASNHKRVHVENKINNNDGINGNTSVVRRTELEEEEEEGENNSMNGSVSSIATLLSQLPHTPANFHHQLETVGDGILPQPYQLSGINWYT